MALPKDKYLASSVIAATNDPHAGEGREDSHHRLDSLTRMIIQQLRDEWEGAERIAEVCQYALESPGKYFRPILLLESAAAVGSSLDTVLPAAAGAESAHVASLMHDDIIDGDEMRRGKSAVHVAFGRDSAIVAGDALIFQLFACLAKCAENGIDDGDVVRAMREAANAGVELCRGQMLEEEIRENRDWALSTYLRMIEQKTAALFSACCSIGGTLGRGTDSEIAALARYGKALGTAFQMQDDILPYLTNDAPGKPRSSDVANQRLTLPVLLCRAGADDDTASELDTMLSGEGDIEGRQERLSKLLAESGAVDRAGEMARESAWDAIDALDDLDGGPSKTMLIYFAKATVRRCR